MDLKDVLSRIAQRWNYKFTEISESLFGLDVALKQTDGTFRFQYVYIRTEQPEGGQKRLYITSTCGVYSNSINFYNILKENGFCNYTTITMGSRKNKEGNPEEVLMVQAAPLDAHTSPDLLDVIIFEVAFNADYIEKRYFGADVN